MIKSAVILIAVAFTLGACGNTFVGVGKDIMTIGEKMQKDKSEDK